MIRKYPEHFYEPIRREIAANQIRHDLRKLFPDLKSDQWRIIDDNINNWFEGEDYELEPVHDFWNFFGGFSGGLKLKSLLFWITAGNTSWHKTSVETKNIVISWDYPGLEFIGKAPYPASQVMVELAKPKNSKLVNLIKRDSDFRSRRYPPRDQFPIILFDDRDGKVFCKHRGFYILEGNRRTIRAIITGKKKIDAYVGTFKNKDSCWPENFWPRTDLLRELIFLANFYEIERDEKAFKTIRNFYLLLLRDFDVARIATFDKSFKYFEKNERLEKEILEEDFKY